MRISKAQAKKLGIKAPAKRSKFNARMTVVDGRRFHSKAESVRYGELKLLEKAGEITDLELQPKYPFFLRGKMMFTYLADFRYKEPFSLGWVIEDVKGMKTPVYLLKKKIIECAYGIEIKET